MKHPLPARPELGTRDGIAYALFLPEGEPQAGVVICHGAGSAKESHFDFARTARDRGLAALAYDARGHGRSSGELGPGLAGDALASRSPGAGHSAATAPTPPFDAAAAMIAVNPPSEDPRSATAGACSRIRSHIASASPTSPGPSAPSDRPWPRAS